MMTRKSITLTGIGVLLLAGCSASVSIADSSNTVEVAKKPVVQATSSFNASGLVKQAKISRNTVQMNKVVKYLKTRVQKTSYVFAGSSPYGWDCSGMVRWAYARFGLDIPHSANKQGHIGTRVSNPKLGDIVVFAYKNSTNFYHSAIYIGNNKIVHANQARKTTVIEPLSNYKNSQIRFVRLVQTD
jgi:cell wall-associated NlpC family hydrolase